MLTTLAALLALAGVVIAVSACNTIERAGEDLKAAGGAIEKSASKTKGY